MNDSQTLPTLLHYLLYWEQIQPDAIFLRQPQPTGEVIDYSWAQVADQARRMARYLHSLELAPGSNIALLSKNSAHWIIADLAIALAGHVSVPIYHSANSDTVGYILEHSEARLLFVGRLDGAEARWQSLCGGVPAELPVVRLPLTSATSGVDWNDLIQRIEPVQPLQLPAPEQLATIIYTSGTTGHPKGVMHSFGTMCVGQRGMAQITHNGEGLSPKDRLLSYLPLAHVAERGGIEATALYAGCSVYFNEGAETFAQDLRQVRPTMLFSVPRLWTKFYQAAHERVPVAAQQAAFSDPVQGPLLKARILAELGLDQVRTAFTGSAALPVEIVSWYRELGLDLLEGYGMSENFGYAHFSRFGRVRVGYVGERCSGVESRIGEDGEILVKSPGQMLGYYKRPDLMADCYTADGFFRTGDKGEFDEAGRLRITGRVKELFKTSKGKYISPVPIEMKLVGHSLIEDACVAGGGLPQPFALLTLSQEGRQLLGEQGGAERLTAQLEEYLAVINAQLEAHERLDRLVVLRESWTIENGLLTPTLKIRRSLIEERYQGRFETWYRQGLKVIVV